MRKRPKVGDRLEAALWFNGFYEQERESAKTGVRKALDAVAEQHRLRLGQVPWTELAPGDDRVPEPPAHMHRGVKLMLGEAEVLDLLPFPPAPRAFVDDLERVDLLRLRQITRDAHARQFPDRPALSDSQCDEVIEAIGPDSAMKAVRAAVDGGTVH